MTSHAESFNIVGISVPANDYEEAWSQVPEGATVHSVSSSPKDWTSVLGFLNNLMGFTTTQISWTE